MVDRGEDTAYFFSIGVSLQIRRTAIAGFGRHTARKETWYGHGCCRSGSELKYGQSPMFSSLKLFVYDDSDMIDHGKNVPRNGYFPERCLVCDICAATGTKKAPRMNDK